MASERSPETISAQRRSAVAWSVALAAHALALAWMLAQPPAEQASAPQPIVVELREVTPPAPPRAPIAVPSPPRPPAHHAPRSHSAPQVTARPDLPQAPAAGGSGSGTGGLASGTESPENEGVGAPPAIDPKGVRLFDPGALDETVQRWKAQESDGTGGGLGGLLTGGVGTTPGDGRGTGDGDGDGPEAEKARVSDRIARDVDDMQAAGRVRAGMVDPYFRDLRFGMKDEWKPSAEQMGGSDESFGGKVRNMLKGWSAAGSQFAKTGSPYKEGEGPNTIAEGPVTRPQNGTSGFDGVDFAARWNSGEFAFSGGLVVLQLVQDQEGHPLDVRVLQSSGFAAFDDSAKEAVQRVAQVRLAPSHGLGLGGSRIRSVWQLAARMVPKTCNLPADLTGMGGVGVLPGLQCGGTFDLGYKAPELDKPGSTKIVTSIELLAIYGGETGPRDETPAK